jgi:hypothetical protein
MKYCFFQYLFFLKYFTFVIISGRVYNGPTKSSINSNKGVIRMKDCLFTYNFVKSGFFVCFLPSGLWFY